MKVINVAQSLELHNFIERFFENMPDEIKAERNQVLEERKKEVQKVEADAKAKGQRISMDNLDSLMTILAPQTSRRIGASLRALQGSSPEGPPILQRQDVAADQVDERDETDGAVDEVNYRRMRNRTVYY